MFECSEWYSFFTNLEIRDPQDTSHSLFCMACPCCLLPERGSQLGGVKSAPQIDVRYSVELCTHLQNYNNKPQTKATLNTMLTDRKIFLRGRGLKGARGRQRQNKRKRERYQLFCLRVQVKGWPVLEEPFPWRAIIDDLVETHTLTKKLFCWHFYVCPHYQ